MKNKDTLSIRSLEIFNILSLFIKENGFPPTIREIKNRSTIKSTSTIKLHLDNLENMNLIKRIKGCSRAIKLEGLEIVQKNKK